MSPNSASDYMYIDDPRLPTCNLEVLIQTKYVQEMITCIVMQGSSLFSFSPLIYNVYVFNDNGNWSRYIEIYGWL